MAKPDKEASRDKIIGSTIQTCSGAAIWQRVASVRLMRGKQVTECIRPTATVARALRVLNQCIELRRVNAILKLQ